MTEIQLQALLAAAVMDDDETTVQLIDEIHRLRTALEHYADARNWTRAVEYGEVDDWYAPEQHGFAVAREALKEQAK